MQKLNDTQKKFLEESTRQYRQSLRGSPAEAYLTQRGLVGDVVDRFRLGYVDEPLPGHEYQRGRLAIPYLRWSPGQGWCVITMKFRCLEDHEGTCKDAHPKVGKYTSHTGGGLHIYNTLAVIESHHDIAICEGELDAVTSTMCGIPAVALPGTESWQPHFGRIFKGYRNVWMFADADDEKGQGRNFAEKLAQDPFLKQVSFKIVPMPEGFDVNSAYLEFGKQALWKAIGREVPQ